MILSTRRAVFIGDLRSRVSWASIVDPRPRDDNNIGRSSDRPSAVALVTAFSVLAAVAQVRQDGEHAPVLGGRLPEAELVEDTSDVLLDGGLGDDERLGDAAVGLALRHRP